MSLFFLRNYLGRKGRENANLNKHFLDCMEEIYYFRIKFGIGGKKTNMFFLEQIAEMKEAKNV